MRFHEWTVRHRRSLLFLVVIAILGGAASILRLPVSLFPHVSFPRIAVSVDAGVRPAPQMEIEVTRRLEQALRSVRFVRNVRSTTSRGSADISVDFAWGTDMPVALLEVEAQIGLTLPQLPPGTSYTARRMDPVVFPVMAFSLLSDEINPIALRDFADYQLAPALSAVSGVARIDVQGGQIEEYRVSVDPDRMRARGLAVTDVAKALAAENVLTAVGRLEDRHKLFLVLSDTRFRSIDQIRHTVLKSGSDGVVELEDVATVGVADAPQFQRVTADGHAAVLMPVYQQPGANTVQIGKDLDTKLHDLAGIIPKGTEIRTWYNQGVLVSQSVASVRDAIAIGVGLAAIVLFAFLRSWRVTAIGIVVVPAVLAMTGLLLWALGMSLNIMTLGGAAAAVGLIIDDTIVTVEHVLRRLRSRANGDKSGVIQAARELTEPLAGSSASTIIIFLPLAFLSGVTGAFFKALSLTMASALVISFLVAWLIVPLIADVALSEAEVARDDKGSVGAWLDRAFRSSLAVGLRRPWLALFVVLPLAGVGYLAFTKVGSGFMPVMDEGGFILDYRTQPGTSLTETDRLLREIGTILKSMPEVETWSRRTGLQLGGGLTEANTGDFFVRLKPPPRRGIEQVMAEVRSKVGDNVPGVKIELAQLMEDLIGDLTAVPQPIEVKLFGSDPQQLRDVATKVAQAIGKVSGIVDVKNGIVIAGDALEIKVDRQKASFEGVTPGDVTTQLSDYVTGNVASQVEQTVKVVGIRVWVPDNYRDTVEALARMQLRASDGHLFPLSRIAKVDIVTGQPEIDRENLRRMVAVTGRIDKRSIGSVALDVEQALRSGNLIPKGVSYELGGLYRQQQIAMRDLTIVFVAAIVLVFALLLFLYENFLVAAVIILMPLLAMGAVFVGLWLTGTERNITAMMGMTMVIGIVTEIAIFYFSEFRVLTKEGHPDALTQAGVNRFRPIAMTTIAAILALFPLALAIGQGSAMLKPLAIAIISGLIVQIPLVLWVMPVTYGGLCRIGLFHSRR
ncbi:efflux RND transporter permease subunit [uncultured Bradyrhizobium sp.]|uniref:efflux RND transporter permease subunit n=1 Tax=uncultured Bradyrhizobium sp. TaxID=199684 RepID=UPI002637D6FC|nr:efflux RND transporter permease subunit [uncultured Bradyrhizobium sp.]